MPTTKSSGHSTRENEKDRRMGSQSGTSSSDNNRSNEQRSGSGNSNRQQGGNMQKPHK